MITVVVCTLPERRQLLTRCLWYLERQTRRDFKAFIAHGDKPKGDKLNRAFALAETDYVMVCDDDDWLSETHMEHVIPQLGPDFIGYDAAQLVDGRFSQVIHQETGSHICPIRTDLARQVEFTNGYFEDIRWTKQVAGLVKTETYIDRPLYYYDKWNKPGGQWSPPRQVGWWPHDKTRWQWI